MFFYGLRGLSLLYLPYSDFSFAHARRLRAVLRARLFRHRAADGPAHHRHLRQDRHAGGLWLGVRGPPGRRRLDRAHRRRAAHRSRQLFLPFMLSGLMCLGAAVLVLRIGRSPRGAGAQARSRRLKCAVKEPCHDPDPDQRRDRARADAWTISSRRSRTPMSSSREGRGANGPRSDILTPTTQRADGSMR